MERLKKIGSVKAVHSLQVGKSTLGLGFEKLDRNVFDPEKAYDKVAALGVKWIRIQSGWARTETEKGVYRFEWLDSVVDNLLRRGLIPWLCLCYGNGLYDEAAAKAFGAVGHPPVKTQEQKAAWAKYVEATVTRYKGKITWFEVWNEPDWCWKHGVSGTEYGQFVLDTAEAVRKANPEAKIIGGVTGGVKFPWVADMIATGAVKAMDAFSCHGYSPDEQDSVYHRHAMQVLCRESNPDLQFIQGETGTQSRSDGAGALSGGAWTPLLQAKCLLRLMLAYMAEGVLFNSYFSCMDMIEALLGNVDDKSSYLDYGYFGVLGADFDENGFSTGDYTPKPSYRALQVLAAIFREDFLMRELPIRILPKYSVRMLRTEDRWSSFAVHGFAKPNGSKAWVYWNPCELLTATYRGTISLEMGGLSGKIRLVDLLDGSVYELPDSMVKVHESGNGVINIDHLPAADYPLLLTFGDFVEF